MGRFVTPALLLAVGLYVGWYNGSHADSALMLPGVDMLVGGKTADPKAAGSMSVDILVGLAVVTGIWAAIGVARDRRRPDRE